MKGQKWLEKKLRSYRCRRSIYVVDYKRKTYARFPKSALMRAVTTCTNYPGTVLSDTHPGHYSKLERRVK